MIESLWRDAATVDEAAAATVKRTDSVIDGLLKAPLGLETRVYEAMRYSALAPGKRLRPLLVLASARLFGVARQVNIDLGYREREGSPPTEVLFEGDSVCILS